MLSLSVDVVKGEENALGLQSYNVSNIEVGRMSPTQREKERWMCVECKWKSGGTGLLTGDDAG